MDTPLESPDCYGPGTPTLLPSPLPGFLLPMNLGLRNEPSRGHSWLKKHRQYLGCSYPRVLTLGPKRYLSPLQGLMPGVWMWCWGLCSSKAWSCPLSSGLSDSPLITCSAETGVKFKPPTRELSILPLAPFLASHSLSLSF